VVKYIVLGTAASALLVSLWLVFGRPLNPDSSHLYISNSAGEIFLCKTGSRSSPTRLVFGEHTRLDRGGATGNIAVDGLGNMYVTVKSESMMVFRGSVRGDAAPTDGIQEPNAKLLIFADKDRVYVFDTASLTLLTYKTDVNGRLHQFSSTEIAGGEVFPSKEPLTNTMAFVLGPGGPLYTTLSGYDAVVVFAEGAGEGPAGGPPPTLFASSTIEGGLTGLDGPRALALDPGGNIYVLNRSSVVVFSPGAKGNTPPLRIISGPATGLDQPTALAVDQSGIMYVADFRGQISAYRPGTSGDAAPDFKISIDGIVGSVPVGLALGP
jgi:hypothetical protein